MAEYDVETSHDGMFPRVEVKYNGETYLEWWDGTHAEAPEDLTWGRSLGRLFSKGVKLGKEIANNEEEAN